MNKHHWLFILLLISLPSLSADKVFSTPAKPVVVIDSDGKKHRVCYYQGEAYSLGAMIKIDDHLLRCQAENDFETNGALQWVTINTQQVKSEN